MWLQLTMPNGSKELFNMTTCCNVETLDNGNSLLYWFDVRGDTTIEVEETQAELAMVLGARGKDLP